MELTAKKIADFIDGQVSGDPDAKVSSIAKIEEGHTGALSFLANPKYEHYIYDTLSSIVIVQSDFEPRHPVKSTLIKVADPYGAFARLLKLYAANKPSKTGISSKSDVAHSAAVGTDCYIGSFAVIGENAAIGNNVKIYPQVYVGDRVKIGDNTIIYAGVRIYEECVIGSGVIIHSGAVIGADGFGFAPDGSGNFNKIPQIGNVVIEDDVEIGANTCVDRATMGSTFIRRGVKLDNLIQVAHNVSVGENTVAAAQVGIAGTSKVGRNCMLGGQVGISGHITIADGACIGSQSGVSNSIREAGTYLGSPTLPGLQFHRTHAALRRLPELGKAVAKMEKQIAELIAERKK